VEFHLEMRFSRSPINLGQRAKRGPFDGQFG